MTSDSNKIIKVRFPKESGRMSLTFTLGLAYLINLIQPASVLTNKAQRYCL